MIETLESTFPQSTLAAALELFSIGRKIPLELVPPSGSIVSSGAHAASGAIDLEAIDILALFLQSLDKTNAPGFLHLVTAELLRLAIHFLRNTAKTK